MTWPDAVALLAIMSVVCWIVIASLFIGFGSPDGDTIASDRDLREILEFAPAAGEEEPETEPSPEADTPPAAPAPSMP